MKSLLMRLFVVALCAFGLLSMASAQQPAPFTPNFSKVLADALAWTGPAEGEAAKEVQIKPGDKVSFMGDSITAQGGYVRLAAAALKADYADLTIPAFTNAGVGGQKAENMEPRFEKDMKLADKPAWTFISVGINDVWHRLGAPHDQAVLDAYKANVTKMVEKAQAAGAKAVLLTPTVITETADAEGNKRLTLYVDAMKSIAKEKGCIVIDLHGYFLNAIAKKPAGMPLTSDGVHMGIYGDAIMAIGVLRALGVPDATIANTDTLSLIQMRPFGMTLQKTAEVLEVPATRFARIEFVRAMSF